MLRLILDSFNRLEVQDEPFRFLPGANWHSEISLASRFRPRKKGDRLAESFTRADGVIGHFEFRHDTRVGLTLQKNSRQFLVVEAKMMSNLSPSVTNAQGYDQAARNVACMAEAIAASKVESISIEDIGFYVVAPALEVRSGGTNLETCMNPESIRMKVKQRIQAYETLDREEASELRGWESAVFAPLLRRLEETNKLRVVSWEQCIEAIGDNHAPTADELRVYYRRCLDLALSKSA